MNFKLDKWINIVCSVIFLLLAILAIGEALFGFENQFYNDRSLVFPWGAENPIVEKRLLVFICTLAFGCSLSCWGDISYIRDSKKTSVAGIINIISSAASLVTCFMIIGEMTHIYDSHIIAITRDEILIKLPIAKGNIGMTIFVLCTMLVCSLVSTIQDIKSVKS
jgi:hypothetical protein